MSMALPMLKPGGLARFNSPLGHVYGQAIVVKEGVATIVDSRGQLHEARPSECDPVPAKMAGRLKFVTDRVIRSVSFRRRLTAHGETTYHRRPRERRKQPSGTYGPSHRPVGYNSHYVSAEALKIGALPNSVHGYPDISDEPMKLAEGMTGTPTERLIRHINWRTKQRGRLLHAVEELERTNRVEAFVFRAVHIGGVPWLDEYGRTLMCPMTAADVARMRGVSPQAVSMADTRARKRLTSRLGYDCLKFAPYREPYSGDSGDEVEEPKDD